MSPSLCAPSLCVNGCGFYASINNFCSKCFKDHVKEHSDHKSENEGAGNENKNLKAYIADLCDGVAAISVTDSTSMKKKRNRCEICNKKVGLTGFECRCGNLFCGTHRYPEEHSCNVDFKKIGRQVLAKQNPKCVGDKLEYRV